MRSILASLFALLLVVSGRAEESVLLKTGAGQNVVEGYCGACHSLDYLRMNASFLNRQGWEAEVNKMIKVFGAPIEPANAKIIIDYLAANYGSGG
jgi:sulfite dehydrogenase (cytochrome) subunit B